MKPPSFIPAQRFGPDAVKLLARKAVGRHVLNLAVGGDAEAQATIARLQRIYQRDPALARRALAGFRS